MTTKTAHIEIVSPLKRKRRCGFDQQRNRAMHISCTPLVNLARKPRPMRQPSASQCQDFPDSSAVQKTFIAQAQKKMLSGSMVIKTDSAAKSGINVTSARHHSAVRRS